MVNPNLVVDGRAEEVREVSAEEDGLGVEDGEDPLDGEHEQRPLQAEGLAVRRHYAHQEELKKVHGRQHRSHKWYVKTCLCMMCSNAQTMMIDSSH